MRSCPKCHAFPGENLTLCKNCGSEIRPNEIPNNCGECSYFKRKGIIDRFKGECLFYEQETSSNWCCLFHANTKEKTAEIRETVRPSGNPLPSNEEGTVLFWESMLGRNVIGLIITIIICGILMLLSTAIKDKEWSENFLFGGGIILMIIGGSLLYTILSGNSGGVSMQITSRCPHCYYKLSLYEIPAKSGKSFQCPECKKTIKK